MKLKLKHRFLLLPTVLVGSLLTSACTDNDQKVITSQNNNLNSNSSSEDNPNTDDSKSSINEEQGSNGSKNTTPKTDVQPMENIGDNSHDGSNSGMSGAPKDANPKKPEEPKQMDKEKESEEKSREVQSGAPKHGSGNDTSTEVGETANGMKHTGSSVPGAKGKNPSTKPPAKATEAEPTPLTGH